MRATFENASSTQNRLSAFMAQNLDWGLWIGLLLVVTALGFAVRSASPHASAIQLQSDPYGTGVNSSAGFGSGGGSGTHSRVEAGS